MMEIKVLGTGCTKCKSLEKVTREAVAEMNLQANVEKVEDIVKIMGYGVLSTPALVVDNQIVVSGRVPSLKETIQLLKKK
jgi:small redox-active disulfide protein 2